MKFSPNQEQIFTLALKEESAIINAVAGSGKTTTVMELARRMPLSGILLAFNKAIAEELSKDLPPNFKASTFHALGFSILKQRLGGKIKVDAKKVFSLIKLSGMNENLAYPASQLVGKAKTYGIGVFFLIDDNEAWAAVLDKSSEIDIPEGFNPEQLVKFAKTFLQKSNEDFSTIDFDDMLYLPLILRNRYNWTFDQYPCIIVDEAQDTNGVQIELLKCLTQRVIAVGDRHQAIYAFRGSYYTAMDKIAEAFNAVEYPLDVSYRCPRLVVDHVRPHVPHIRARENAPDGICEQLEKQSFLKTLGEAPLEQCLIVCRTNAPIMRLCLLRLRNRQKFTCLSDFPQTLLKSVNMIKANGLADFMTKYAERFDALIESLEKKGLRNRVALEQDKYDAIQALVSECETLHGLTHLLNKLMYSDGGPRLSSIHKSKGLQSPTVFFYQSDRVPAAWVIDKGTPDDLIQEQNLYYVACTRAQASLYLIPEGEK